MSKTPEQTIIDTSVDPSLSYLQSSQVGQIVSSENGIITTRTDKGVVYNTVENVTKVISKVVETNVNADWEATTGTGFIKNKPNLGVYATQTQVNQSIGSAIGNLINGAPTALDTLSEIANSLGNNSSLASTITNQLANKADTSYVDELYNTIATNDIGNMHFDNTTMSPVSNVSNITLQVGGDQNFVFDTNGDLSIPGMLVTTGVGTPRFSSATDFIIDAQNRVKIENGAFKLASKTNAERALMLAQAGDMIYNTTSNEVQVYRNGAWSSVGSGGTANTGNIAFAGTNIYNNAGDNIDIFTNGANYSEVWLIENYGVIIASDGENKQWHFKQDGLIHLPDGASGLTSNGNIEITSSGGTIGPGPFGEGIGIIGSDPTSNKAGGQVYIQGGQDMSESGGPTTRGGIVVISGGQGANDVDASHGGHVEIYAGPAARFGGDVRIESGSTYSTSGQAGEILIQSGSSVQGVGGNITIQSGVGTEGLQGFEGALKMRGANVDIVSSFESFKVKTGDVDSQDGGPNVWEFDNAGNLTFPDGTVQSTAFTGSTGGGFDGSQVIEISNTTHSTTATNGALKVAGGVGIGGNLNADGTKHTLNGNLHITGLDSSSLYIGAYADDQPLTAPVLVAKDSYDTYVQAALINSSQYGSADWVAYSNQGDETEGWADMGMTGSNFSDINYSITRPNDGYFFVQGLTGQGGNMVLATGNTGGETHRDIVFATGGFLAENERMRLDHESSTLYIGAHGDLGGTNITNLDVNGSVTARGQVDLGSLANITITGGTSGKVLSTDGTGGLSWVSPQSGPTGAQGQGFNFRGAYDSGASYQPYDVVTDGGFAYVSVQASQPGVGDDIFNTEYWQMFTARGSQGIEGPQGDTGTQGVSVTLQGTLALIADLDDVVNPQQGDAWIVTESNGGDLFFRTSSATWDNIGKIVGPEGPRGPQGLKGDTGSQGEPGTPADTGNFTFNGDTLTSPTAGVIQIPNGDTGGINTLNNRGRLWFGSDTSFYMVTDDTYQFSFLANGKVTFGGGYTFPNVKGTNGQILVTNGSGVLSWQNQAGLTNIFDQTLNTTDDVIFNRVTSPSYDFPNAGGVIQQDGDPGRYNIFINAESNVVIDTNQGTYQWVLGNDGSLTFPNGAKLNNGTANQFATDNQATTSLDLRDTNGAGFFTNNDGYTLRSNSNKNWVFGTDGSLSTPSTWSIGNSGTGTGIGNDGYANPNDLYAKASEAFFILTDTNTYSQGESQWMFSHKNIQLPAGGDIVDSNGTSVLGGGSVNTGNITFSDTTLTSSNGNVKIHFTPSASPAVEFNFTETGEFILPNGGTQRSVGIVSCPPNVDTVIYTSIEQYTHTLKLLLCIEGYEGSNTGNDIDTQSCEMIVAKSHRNNTVSGSAYGLVYTSASPLVTLSTRWDVATSRIEVICRPASLTNSVSVRITGTELTTTQI